jgi:hypothetical protein
MKSLKLKTVFLISVFLSLISLHNKSKAQCGSTISRISIPSSVNWTSSAI